ncbi:cytochrome c [Robiginitalea sp. SC105]|uniref:c-type cytochrome n=1 Tax=Robiginitalea sp. SC105 TaxID=2762332 RepID=UPI00163AFFF1|nr:cytochrome c [Robiginitalea sp. SC105]MBC2838761.1 cytochrome c [Robiginitalea sp. SC105]
MKNTLYTALLVTGLVLLASCQDKRKPNYQYMPNMYEPVGYEAYDQVEWLPDGSMALRPAENTVARGALPYRFENTPEGKEMSRAMSSPLDSLSREENLEVGAELYGIYCAICHGSKGDGQGNLVKREKILGVPSYADAGRNINIGSTYHVIYYGQNAMGSYANQLDETERWQVAEYVMKLKEDLTK